MTEVLTTLERSAIMLTNEANTLPMTSKELDQLATLSVLETIEPDRLARALISPPFILLESMEKAKVKQEFQKDGQFEQTLTPVACLNFRDCSSASRTPQMRSRMIFRAGKSSFNAICLRTLGIKKVYDLRSEFECQRDPHSIHMKDIQIRWFPPRDHHSILQQIQPKSEEQTFQSALAKSYLAILFSHQEIFRQILLDLCNEPEPILIHCTAGKDRTGVAIAMLHSLAGCSIEGIAAEYALTRIGVEPARAHLLNAVKATIPNFSLQDPRFLATSESKAEVMILFLHFVQERFGGFEGYVETILGLTKEEIKTIKSNLTA